MHTFFMAFNGCRSNLFHHGLVFCDIGMFHAANPF
jgi:hypothetical protein